MQIWNNTRYFTCEVDLDLGYWGTRKGDDGWDLSVFITELTTLVTAVWIRETGRGAGNILAGWIGITGVVWMFVGCGKICWFIWAGCGNDVTNWPIDWTNWGIAHIWGEIGWPIDWAANTVGMSWLTTGWSNKWAGWDIACAAGGTVVMAILVAPSGRQVGCKKIYTFDINSDLVIEPKLKSV